MDNKRLVEKVANSLGRNTADVNKLLETLVGTLQARCAEMSAVSVPSFGTFEPHKHNEHIITNPDTGKRTLVPPRVTLDFTVSRVLKNKLKSTSAS